MIRALIDSFRGSRSLALAAMFLLLATLVGCDESPSQVATEEPELNFARSAHGWYRGDLHYHTTYSGDAKSQGGDDLATCLAIADAYRDPTYLARHPERGGDGLDFIAVTDHRTLAGMSDPAFSHPHLIVLPGQEYGGDGHAGNWGISKLVSHEPAAGQSQNGRHQQSIDEVHAQGGLFSLNHPTQSGTWRWDVTGYDAIEVWNSPWSAFWGERHLADVEAALSQQDNPYIRAGLERVGGGVNHQALWFWYAHLNDAVHVPIVGGGDRHMLLPAGLPTTYVSKPDGPAYRDLHGRALGVAGILAGIRAGGTFVSRSPHGAQVELTATDEAGVRHSMGAPLASSAQNYVIDFRVTRASGGLLRLVAGPIKPRVSGRVEAEAKVVFELALDDDHVTGSFQWQPAASGGWLHAIVLEQRIVGELPASMEQTQVVLSSLPKSEKSIGQMLQAMVPLLKGVLLTDASKCDPQAWQDDKPWCMPADREGLATYYLPDAVVRLLNTWFEQGQPTQYCLGAVTSAFMTKAP